jgi:hypothetical protein
MRYPQLDSKVQKQRGEKGEKKKEGMDGRAASADR